jgi:hypothetical protein
VALKNEIASAESLKKSGGGDNNSDVSATKKAVADKKKTLLKLRQENELLREKISIQKDTNQKLKSDKEGLSTREPGSSSGDVAAKVKVALQKELEDTETAIRQETAVKEQLRSSGGRSATPPLPTRSLSKPASNASSAATSPTKAAEQQSAFVPFDSAASSRFASAAPTPPRTPTLPVAGNFEAFDSFESDAPAVTRINASGFEAFGGDDLAFNSSSPTKVNNAFDSSAFDAFPMSSSPEKSSSDAFNAFPSPSKPNSNISWDDFIF